MAVNRITNKQTLNRESVNRATQVSTKDNKVRGNAEQSINPGKDFTKNFSVTLKDIDTSVMTHIKSVMKLMKLLKFLFIMVMKKDGEILEKEEY